MKKEDQARLALAEFNKMLPMLNGFARSFSGNLTAKVQAGTATLTDGKTITIRPPMALAYKDQHKRTLCEVRDNTYQQRCRKCGTRESVMSYLYHEMAHIMFGSFDEQESSTVKAATINALGQCDDEAFSEYVLAKVSRRKSSSHTTSSQSWARCVSPYLTFIHQALEDYRIDSASFTARAGIKMMRFAATERVLNEGIENDSGENVFWIDQKLNAQLAVAMLCVLHDHIITDRFLPEVVEALEDEKLLKILGQMDDAKDPLDTYHCAIQALVRLRELGFFLSEGEPDPSEDEDDADDEGEEGEDAPDTEGEEAGGDGEPGDGEPGDGEPGDGEPGDGEPGEQPEPADYGTPEDVEAAVGSITGHEKGEEIAEEDVDRSLLRELAKAINQLAYLDHASGVIEKVRIFKGPDGPSFDDKASFGRQAGLGADLTIPETVVGKSVLEARRAFTDNKQSHMQRHKKSGRVSGASLGKRAWNNDERLFQKKLVPGRRDYEVLIGLDASGSTVGDEIRQIKRSAAALAEVCARSGVDFSMWTHTGDIVNDDGSVGWDYDKNASGYSLDLSCIKGVQEPWDSKRKGILQRVTSCAGNFDGHTMEFYRKQLDKSKATDKVLMYFTDGAMPASNYDEELVVLQREIKTCKQLGYTLLGVGIGTTSPQAHGLDTVRVDDDSDIIRVVKHLTKELTK